MSDSGHDHEHGHAYVDVARTDNIVAYEETVHQVVTIRLLDRGLALDMTREEARELADALAQISAYLARA